MDALSRALHIKRYANFEVQITVKELVNVPLVANSADFKVKWKLAHAIVNYYGHQGHHPSTIGPSEKEKGKGREEPPVSGAAALLQALHPTVTGASAHTITSGGECSADDGRKISGETRRAASGEFVHPSLPPPGNGSRNSSHRHRTSLSAAFHHRHSQSFTLGSEVSSTIQHAPGCPMAPPVSRKSSSHYRDRDERGTLTPRLPTSPRSRSFSRQSISYAGVDPNTTPRPSGGEPRFSTSTIRRAGVRADSPSRTTSSEVPGLIRDLSLASAHVADEPSSRLRGGGAAHRNLTTSTTATAATSSAGQDAPLPGSTVSVKCEFCDATSTFKVPELPSLCVAAPPSMPRLLPARHDPTGSTPYLPLSHSHSVSFSQTIICHVAVPLGKDGQLDRCDVAFIVKQLNRRGLHSKFDLESHETQPTSSLPKGDDANDDAKSVASGKQRGGQRHGDCKIDLMEWAPSLASYSGESYSSPLSGVPTFTHRKSFGDAASIRSGLSGAWAATGSTVTQDKASRKKDRPKGVLSPASLTSTGIISSPEADVSECKRRRQEKAKAAGANGNNQKKAHKGDEEEAQSQWVKKASVRKLLENCKTNASLKVDIVVKWVGGDRYRLKEDIMRASGPMDKFGYHGNASVASFSRRSSESSSLSRSLSTTSSAVQFPSPSRSHTRNHLAASQHSAGSLYHSPSLEGSPTGLANPRERQIHDQVKALLTRRVYDAGPSSQALKEKRSFVSMRIPFAVDGKGPTDVSGGREPKEGSVRSGKSGRPDSTTSRTSRKRGQAKLGVQARVKG